MLTEILRLADAVNSSLGSQKKHFDELRATEASAGAVLDEMATRPTRSPAASTGRAGPAQERDEGGTGGVAGFGRPSAHRRQADSTLAFVNCSSGIGRRRAHTISIGCSPWCDT